MPSKTSALKSLSCLVLLSFLLTLLPGYGLAAPTADAEQVRPGPAVEATVTDLAPASFASRYALQEEEGSLVVAHATGAKASRADAEQVKRDSCCGDFWDVHFGGYRWAWWALAGVGLIAIHAD